MSKTYCEETHCQMFESAKKQIRADAIEDMYVSVKISIENVKDGANIDKEFEWLHQFDAQLKEQTE